MQSSRSCNFGLSGFAVELSVLPSTLLCSALLCTPGEEMHVNSALTERGIVVGYLMKHDKFESQVTRSSSVYVYMVCQCVSTPVPITITEYDAKNGSTKKQTARRSNVEVTGAEWPCNVCVGCCKLFLFSFCEKGYCKLDIQFLDSGLV